MKIPRFIHNIIINAALDTLTPGRDKPIAPMPNMLTCFIRRLLKRVLNRDSR